MGLKIALLWRVGLSPPHMREGAKKVSAMHS